VKHENQLIQIQFSFDAFDGKSTSLFLGIIHDVDPQVLEGGFALQSWMVLKRQPFFEQQTSKPPAGLVSKPLCLSIEEFPQGKIFDATVAVQSMYRIHGLSIIVLVLRFC
jgi:hypothetical protein